MYELLYSYSSYILHVDFPTHNNQGQKRPLETGLDTNEHNKRSNSLNDSNSIELFKLKQKVSELEAKLIKVEDELIRT